MTEVQHKLVRQKNSSFADGVKPWKGRASGPGAGSLPRSLVGPSQHRAARSHVALLRVPAPHRRAAIRGARSWVTASQPAWGGGGCRCPELRPRNAVGASRRFAGTWSPWEARSWMKRRRSFQSRSRILGRNQFTSTHHHASLSEPSWREFSCVLIKLGQELARAH